MAGFRNSGNLSVKVITGDEGNEKKFEKEIEKSMNSHDVVDFQYSTTTMGGTNDLGSFHYVQYSVIILYKNDKERNKTPKKKISKRSL